MLPLTAAPLAALALLPLAGTSPAPVPPAAGVARYEVSVPAPSAHLFHVSVDLPTGGLDTVLVALPAWSPGNYEIQNYARYVRHFAAESPSGAPLFWDRFDKETWRVLAAHQDRIRVSFDFLADTIDLSLARIADDFGQFLGTNLFLYQPGKLDRAAEVRFVLPAGWQVTTSLPGSGPGPYRAANYDQLADAETFVGSYALDSMTVDNRPFRIAVWPRDAYTAAVARNMRTDLTKIAETENRMMGGPPYDEYTVFFNAISEPISFGGGLEHANAQYDIMPAAAFADVTGQLGDFMVPLMSHEYFHIWNVKRVRPAAMWPYDYRNEQYTPLLWWSEGVTDYYADLTNLRSGLWTPDQFLRNTMTNMDEVEATPEPWSEEDGSIATWINEIYVNSSELYYPKGTLTGMLLDIAIRNATDDAHSLDDVMRALYARYYQQGHGFTTANLLALLRETGLPGVDAFYRRFIMGRDPLPYDSIFPAAGIVVTRHTTSVPFFGVNAPLNDQGRWVVATVEPGSSAERAGVQPGDVLDQIGDIALRADSDWSVAFRERYEGRAGAPLAVTVERQGQPLTLAATVQERSVTTFLLTRTAAPTPKQAKIWQGLATGTTGG